MLKAETAITVKTPLLKELTDRAGEFRFDDDLRLDLKGLPNAQRVYEVRWRE